MPLVKIDMIKGTRSPTEIKKMGEVIQQIMLDHFNAPERDRYQIVTQHEEYELMCEDTNLGFERTKNIVMIQIFQQGRSDRQKQEVYKYLHEGLSRECGLAGTDLIISCVENTHAD